VRSSSDLSAESLSAAQDPHYPELFRKPAKFEVRVEGNAETLVSSTVTSNTPLGFAYRSADQKQIYQVRTDGFTHNRLKPYQEWDLFVAEARRLWNVYKKVVRPVTIELIGLNYLNEILLPLGTKFDEYFNTYIEVPVELPQTLNVFSLGYQLTIPEDQGKGFIHIGQGYGMPKEQGLVTVNLNIQAFRQVDLPFEDSDDDLWPMFEALRKAKSHAFEACITDKVREMIR
jgi:uncharacterized protein (TIGR04255 family)